MISNKIRQEFVYKPCRIIYYNSGRYTFFETNLDKNTILFGNNNAGKTSFLNGLQFFLLPEINLKRLHEKFSFSKKYNKEQTYEYYFPKRDSFIVAEFENPFGRFVQIIFRGKDDYEYHRIFSKARYEDIKDLLWDSKNKSVKLIDYKDFTDYLKKTPNYKYVNTIDQIIDLIYSSDVSSEDRGRYSIVPIHSKHENIKNIIKLAFNIDIISDIDIKEILLTFIESNLKNKKDVIDFDFHYFCDKQTEYKKELEHYSSLKNHIHLYDSCIKNIELLKNIGPQIKKNYVDFYLLNKDLNFTFSEKIETLNKEAQDLDNKREISKEKYKQTAEKYKKELNNLEYLNNTLSTKKEQYSKYLKILEKHNLSDKDKLYILNYFEDKKKAIDLDLSIIEDKRKIEDEIYKIKNKIKTLEKDNDERITVLKDYKDPSIVYNQLNEEESIILRTLFPKESKSKHQLSDEEKNVIKNLKNLVYFNNSNNYYYLFGNKLSKFEEKFNEENEKKLILENEENIKKLSETLISKESLLSNETSKNKERLILDKTNLMNDYEFFNKNNHIDEINELEQKILNVKDLISVLKEEMSNTHILAEQDKNLHSNKLEEIKQIQKEESTHKELYKKCTVAADKLGINIEIDDENKKSQINSLNEELVANFIKDLDDSEKAKSSIKSALITFVKEKIIIDTENQIVLSELQANDMQHIFKNKVEPLYENIEERRKGIESSMISGFNEAYNAATNISEYRNLILSSISQFNNDLKNISISNFKNISLTPNFNMRFQDFNEHFNKFDNHNPTEETITNFFIKLRQLLTEIGLTDKLTLSKVINDFTVKFHKHDGTCETKSQSNGTNIMANAVILSQLKNELVKDGTVKYQIPIIIDEVSHIDNKNFKILKNFLNEKELIIFCATPTPSISSDNNYDSVIYLSHSLGNTILDPERPIVYALPEEIKIEKTDSIEESFGRVVED